MPKILLVGSLISGQGGTETVIKKLITLLSDEFKFKIVMIKSKNDKSKNIDWLNNLDYEIKWTNQYFHHLKKISITLQLKKIIKKENPCLIICYDAKGCLFSYKAVNKIKNRCEVISWLHFSFNTFSYKEKKNISKLDHHLTIAEEIKGQMINYGIDKNRISTIYNPVERKITSIPTSHKNEKLNFIYIGRVQYSEQKNLKEMFMALSELKYDYNLHLIGDNAGEVDDIKKLKGLAKLLNISNKITFHGWKKDPWNYILNEIKYVDALLFSSKYEGFGMALVEAISYGVFCISSGCSTGPKEIINDKNGFIYKAGNVDDFVAKLNKFYEMEILKKDDIKESINNFYDEIYTINLKKIIKKHIIFKY